MWWRLLLASRFIGAAVTVDFATGSHSHNKSNYLELVRPRFADCIFLRALGELCGEMLHYHIYKYVFQMPDQVRHDEFGSFAKPLKCSTTIN